MNTKQLPSLAVLTGIVVIVGAPIIYFHVHRVEKSEQQEQQADAQIANVQAQADFIRQYVNTNFTRLPGVPLVAVAVAAEDKTMNLAMGAALISRFKGEHAEFVDSFFKPPVVSDGLFNDVFNGSSALFARLQITNSVDAVLLGREDVQYSTNTSLDNVITANMSLKVVTFPVAGQFQSTSWSFSAKGNGFRPAEARMQAEEEIIKQMSDQLDMKLNPVIYNH